MKVLKNQEGQYLTHNLTFDSDRSKAKVYTAKIDNLIKIAGKHFATTYENIETKEVHQFDITSKEYVLGIIKGIQKKLDKNIYLNGGCGYFALLLLRKIEDLSFDSTDDFYIKKIHYPNNKVEEHYVLSYYYLNSDNDEEIEFDLDITGEVDYSNKSSESIIGEDSIDEFEDYLLKWVNSDRDEKRKYISLLNALQL